MDTITGLLILIGVLILYVIYLQLRLLFFPKQTVVVVPQSNQEGPTGCAATALAVVIIVLTIAVALLLELPSIL